MQREEGCVKPGVMQPQAKETRTGPKLEEAGKDSACCVKPTRFVVLSYSSHRKQWILGVETETGIEEPTVCQLLFWMCSQMFSQ